MASDDTEVLPGCVLGLSLAVTPILAVWRGAAISLMWSWYAVPVFGVKPLPVVAATGLCMLAGLFTNQRIPSDPKEAPLKSLVALTVHGVLYPAIVLTFGWLFRFWM